MRNIDLEARQNKLMGLYGLVNTRKTMVGILREAYVKFPNLQDKIKETANIITQGIERDKAEIERVRAAEA